MCIRDSSQLERAVLSNHPGVRSRGLAILFLDDLSQLCHARGDFTCGRDCLSWNSLQRYSAHPDAAATGYGYVDDFARQYRLRRR